MKKNVMVFESANALYHEWVETFRGYLQNLISQGREPVVLLPTGNTMIPFYRMLTDKQDQFSFQNCHFFPLDEYAPLTAENHHHSFKNYLDQHFFFRLKVAPKSRFIFQCEQGFDPEKESSRYRETLSSLGGIDIAFLGLGTNGHIAFNEPGSSMQSTVRTLDLHPQTLMANFGMSPIFSRAITVGIQEIISARQIFVVALGKSKANAVKAAIEEPISSQCPASFLHKASNVRWLLDKEAAQYLSPL